MNCLSRMHCANLLALGAVVSCGMAVATAQTPIPKSTKLPTTFYTPELRNSPPDAFPIDTFSRNFRPRDLKKAGFVEEEFLVSGAANVYDLAADGSLTVVAPNAPYTTRILVRRPADPAKFSGAIMVEIPNEARSFDWYIQWGTLADEILARGDAWVGVTTSGGMPGMKSFNPRRYAAVAFNNPIPNACPAAPRNPTEIEDGLKWDMLSQIGALLKSNTPDGPMAGFKVEALYMTTQGADVVTYANVIHPHVKMADGKFVYNGFLFKQPGGLARLNRCATAPARDDPRGMTKDLGVPVIAVVAQGELPGAASSRRADSDDEKDRYRRYEVAGGTHLDMFNYDSFPSMNDETAAGNAQGTPEYPFAARCDPEIQLVSYPLMPFIYHSAFDHLDKWARKGITPPKSSRIELKNEGTPQAAVQIDKYGVGRGGVRTFWADFPTVQFYGNSTGPGNCPEIGHAVPFDWAHLEAMYGNYKGYVAKANQSIDRSVKEGWFTENDAKMIKAQVAVPPANRATGSNN